MALNTGNEIPNLPDGTPDLSEGFIRSTSIAIGAGAFLGLSANWLGRTVVNLTGLPDRISNGILLRCLYRTSEFIARPIKEAHRISRDTFHLSEELFSNTLAPILEEAVYRFGIQGGIKVALTTIGIPSNYAEIIANSTTSILFGVAHDQSFQNQFATDAICGYTFGYINEHYGIPYAVIAHAFNNIVIDLLDRFSHS